MKGTDTERETHREREEIFRVLFHPPKWPQWSKLGQAEAENPDVQLGVPTGGRAPVK